MGWAAWLVFVKAFRLEVAPVRSFPLEILKQINCLVWSRRGPSKTKYLNSLEYYPAGHGGVESGGTPQA